MTLSDDGSGVVADEPEPDSDSEREPDSNPKQTSLDESDPGVLATQLELLRAENRRLRREYARARRSRYRRTALGLALVGAVATLGALAFPAARDVLLALGGTGLFAGLLTYYLTPERFIAASVGEATYAALAKTETDLCAELGLREERLYVPTDAARSARLFVPLHEAYTVPDRDALDSVFVVTAEESSRGVAFYPTGGELFDEFERALADDLGADPATLAEQLTDGLVEQFELVRDAEPELDGTSGRLTVGVSGSAFGRVDRLDHPVASFLAVGLARGLERPVRVETTAETDDRSEYLITCRWTPEDG